MGSRSGISKLPVEIRLQIEDKIIESNYSDYEEIAAWLQELGYDISRSAVGRHGKLMMSKPIVRELKKELEREGFTIEWSDQELERMLLRLGMIVLREELAARKILDALDGSISAKAAILSQSP